MTNYCSNCPRFLAATFCLLIFSALVAAQTADPNIRISQIYTRGGEAGAVFQNDYVELFNRGNVDVDVNGWSLNISNFTGTPPSFQISATTIRLFSSTGIIISPGKHLLIKFGGSGGSGQPTPSDINLNPFPLSDTGGQIVLLGKDKTLAHFYCPAAPDMTGAVVDYVGFGTAICFEGAVTLAPPSDKALTRVNGGCTDNNNNLADFSLATPSPRTRLDAATPCGIQAGSVIDFGAPQFDAFEGSGASAQVTVTRIGDVSSPATVDYFISDNSANERTDYTTTLGTLRFAPGETQKTFEVLITDDAVPEANENAFLGLLNATGNASIGPRNSASLVIHDNDVTLSPNVVDISSSYVRQHYNDFLNRMPDPGGEAFWVDNIESCGSSAQCREVKRIDTSAAFFLSIEFQKTGFFVYRLYKASLPETAQRPRAMPRYREFIRDTQRVGQGVVVGQTGWEQVLEANTVAFANEFVYRPEFLANYPETLSAPAYVEKLNAQAGNVLTFDEFFRLANGLMAGSETRGSILRKVAEHQRFSDAERNSAFVLMQYFGYMRRNPNDAPDTDFSGFDFWLGKLNEHGGDYRAAEMVKAFISSTEYRTRFGQ